MDDLLAGMIECAENTFEMNRTEHERGLSKLRARRRHDSSIYRARHPARIRARSALSRREGANSKALAAHIEHQMELQQGLCYWCHQPVNGVYHVDHVIPLARGGTNDLANLVIACPPCNIHKQDKLPENWTPF